jgi:Tol biopolymer transport system component
MSPSGKKIIFSSNMDDPKSREFDLYLMNADGTDLERVTTAPSFDGFPMWSPDGKKLVWGSNRMSQETHETNIFIADWVD